MTIERKTDVAPNWGPFEYATLSKCDIFSKERWGLTVKWHLLLEQAEQINHIVGLLLNTPYPTRLFFSYIEILEANLFIFNDMFYFLTGGRLTDGIGFDMKEGSHYDETWERLQFWNIDCHDTILKIAESFSKSQNTFRNVLHRSELSFLIRTIDSSCEPETEELSAKKSPDVESVYRYILNLYGEKDLDKVALANHIENILEFLEQNTDYMFQWARGWYSECFLLEDFPSLLIKFINSERGRMILQSWENELNGTREHLIMNLEKDKNYQAWVHKYIHLSDKHNIIQELFADEKSSTKINYKKLNNTDNWLSILSIAAIFQEYDKRQEIIGKLKPFFYNNENKTRSFYESIKGADPKMITAYVNQLANDGVISDKGKGLYTVLHENSLYDPTYQNWNSQT